MGPVSHHRPLHPLLTVMQKLRGKGNNRTEEQAGGKTGWDGDEVAVDKDKSIDATCSLQPHESGRQTLLGHHWITNMRAIQHSYTVSRHILLLEL